MDYDAAVRHLTADDGLFPVERGRLGGHVLPLFKGRKRSLRDVVAAAAAYGDKTFMVYGDRRISYTEFTQRVWGAGRSLTQRFAMAKGDRIGILAVNQPDWLIALFGAASVGGVAVGLNGWWTAAELEYGLNDSGCRFLIVDAQLYPRVAPVLSAVPSLEHVIYIGDNPPEGTIALSELLEPTQTMPTVELDEADPFVILYTSGTTGRSKGCITTHCGTIAQVMGILFNIFLSRLTNPSANGSKAAPETEDGGEIGAIDRAVAKAKAEQPASLLTSPLFHVAALHSTVCTSLMGGAKLVFAPPKFSAEKTLDLLEREQVSTWMAIPTLLSRLMESPELNEYDLSALKSISTGGAPMPPELSRRVRTLLNSTSKLSTTYGLTECHGMATSIDGADYEARPESVGRPSPVMQIRIVGPDGAEVATGESGEILLNGPTITPGYWGRPEATAEAVQDGWLHTGDIGHVDDEGFLYISDRAKDMILRGGENIYCVEIENCLAEHPDIDEAAVLGVPHRDLGESVKAIVVLRAGASLSSEVVQAHVGQHLAGYKVPSEVQFMEGPLPRNPSGKLLKNELRGDGESKFTQSL